MEPSTVSSCILTLHKEFAAYTTQRLQELGLSFGLIYFIIAQSVYQASLKTLPVQLPETQYSQST